MSKQLQLIIEKKLITEEILISNTSPPGL